MDFTETAYAEDFQWDLGSLIDKMMSFGMKKETAILVMQMEIESLNEYEEDEDD